MGGSGGRTGQGSRSDTDSNPSPALHSPVTAAKRLASLKCRPVLVRAGRRAQWLSTRVLPCDARSSPAPPAPHRHAVPHPLLPRAAPGTPATAHLAALDRAQGAEAQALASIPQGGCGAVCCRLSWCQVQGAGPPLQQLPQESGEAADAHFWGKQREGAPGAASAPGARDRPPAGQAGVDLPSRSGDSGTERHVGNVVFKRARKGGKQRKRPCPDGRAVTTVVAWQAGGGAGRPGPESLGLTAGGRCQHIGTAGGRGAAERWAVDPGQGGPWEAAQPCYPLERQRDMGPGWKPGL